jgi:LDH2 family malate/lactate/ureidoglycolate dehydrogenase
MIKLSHSKRMTSAEETSPMTSRLRLSVAEARELAEDALVGIGYARDEARIIADHVIDAALCGYEYSGLAKLLNLPESENFRLPRRAMKVLRETDISLAFDGGNNVGMLALFHAAQATISKAEAHGIALVSVSDAWMSGRSAYYVEMIAKAGLVAIHTASSSRLVAPPGGIRPVLGTNPIAIAVPSSRGPIVLDMGTSAYMMTELMLREKARSDPARGGGNWSRGANDGSGAGTPRRVAAVCRLQGLWSRAHGPGAGRARRSGHRY